MSKRWPGGIVTKNQATPTGPYANGSAPGIWTLNQMSYWVKQALWPTAGLFANYIEDVFSTWLYTGNGSTQTITNGINLSGQGGLVWLKNRTNTGSNLLFDTVRGADNLLQSNQTNAQNNGVGYMTTFNANGFGLTSSVVSNASSQTYASWTFREQPKFFDIVTYTGTGANRTIAHNLGSIPGCIIVKRTDIAADWQVYHRSLANTEYLVLNSGNAKVTSATRWNSTTPTSSVFSLGTDATVNALGGTYVAYIYAHDAGGFGLSGNENVISCGSYVGNGSTTGPTITLGYEPQWVMIKSTAAAHWFIVDSMRGFTVNGLDASLYPSLTSTEDIYTSIYPTATGFGLEALDALFNSNGVTYIYMTIRRGPMQVPTLGTSVFSPITSTSALTTKLTTGFPVDLQWTAARASAGTYNVDRLRGVSTNTTASAQVLLVPTTGAEVANTDAALGWDNTGFRVSSQWANQSIIYWNFRRAPGFFDVVCYSGTGVTFSPQHNLAAIPDLVICKRRNAADAWFVYANGFGGNNARLNSPDRFGSVLNRITAATSTTFTVGGPSEVNQSGGTYVAYLFATVAGVSKVGTYTGTGATLNIDAGFTTGARFVMIKRTDSTGGDWFVWDTARGMVAGTDPRIAINTIVAESNANWVYTVSAGFQIVTTDATVNASGGSYIYLAIA